jgi:translation initiation factor 2B subunit (eIF-2B alpha/beta/delta family)
VHVTSGCDAEKEKDEEKGENLVRVVVRNVSFEWCPPELIDGYITEQGEQTVHDIARRSQELADKERRIFGTL